MRAFQNSVCRWTRLWSTFATAAVALACACPIAAGDDGDDDGYLPRQAMVRLQAGMTIGQFNSQYGTTTLRAIGSRRIYLLQLPVPEGDEEEWLADLLGNPPAALRWAELNYEGQDGEGRTGSFYVSSLIAGNRFGSQYARNTLQLENAHAMSTGSGAIVAVLDTGVDATHPLLAPRIVAGGYNYVDNNSKTADVGDNLDNDGDGLVDESHGHGTFVAGLIAMVAPDAGILPIKVLDSDGRGAGFSFAAGVFRAIDKGADVINMSLGSTYSSQALEDALFESRLRGIVVVGAAGNQASDLEEFPAMKDDGIGVVAVDRNDIKADFSNFNDKADLSAPGVGIFSSIPENSEGHTYARWEGTSMATPLVAGTAALLVSLHPEWAEDHSRHALVQGTLEGSAVNIDPLNPGYQGMMGAGRINAAAAVQFDEPAVAWINNLSITQGTLLFGGIVDLLDDADGRFVTVRSVAGFNANDPNIMEARVRFTTLATPDELEVSVRYRLNTPGGTALVRLRKWTNNTWQVLDSHSIGVDWMDRTVEGVNAAGLVRASDGRILLSIRHTVLASFTTSQFRSYLDLAEIDLE